MNLRQTTPPAAEPVSLTEAKLHLKVDVDEDDTLITGLIKAAREACEAFTGRAFVTQTWKLYLDEFPSCGDESLESQGQSAGLVELPRPRAIAVASVEYYDADGVLQTLNASTYQVDAIAEPARLAPVYGEVWPVTQVRMNAVVITYTAGYGGASDVPASIKQAMLFLIGSWYENREAVITGTIVTELPLGVKALLWNDRIVTFP